MTRRKQQIDTDLVIRKHLRLLGHNGYGLTELRTFDNRPMVAYADNDRNVVQLVGEMDR